MTTPKILLIYTGGTIGMMKDAQTGTLKPFNFSQLLDRIPELHLLSCQIDTHSFEIPIDSSDMNPTFWKQIADIIFEKYHDYDGFVVLHGSDTMAYSASALSFMLTNIQKPIVFTGSQLPIGDLRTDAKENLITAIQIAALQNNNKPVISEVCLYFEYKLYRGNRTTKISAEHFNAFTSPNFPAIAESGVHLKINHELLLKQNNHPLSFNKNFNTDVMVLKLFPGITQNTIEHILQMSHLKGIVLETFGSGNALTSPWFIKAIENAIHRGLHIVNVTQCWGGFVDMNKYENGLVLQNAGVISGFDITTEAAITKMMYILGNNKENQHFKTQFQTSIAGEMSVE